ncbi:MAG: ATP-binding cassette domain-containing protein, partial [Opitutaceae bacterium]
MSSSPSAPPSTAPGAGRSGGPVYHVRGMERIYGEGTAAVTALAGVDLDLFAGELIVLLGASGSGKSTLLNQLGGL